METAEKKIRKLKNKLIVYIHNETKRKKRLKWKRFVYKWTLRKRAEGERGRKNIWSYEDQEFPKIEELF